MPDLTIKTISALTVGLLQGNMLSSGQSGRNPSLEGMPPPIFDVEPASSIQPETHTSFEQKVHLGNSSGQADGSFLLCDNLSGQSPYRLGRPEDVQVCHASQPQV